MRAPQILRELPAEYVVERGPRAWLALHRSAESALREAGFGLCTDGSLAQSTLTGRKPLFELSTRAGNFVVRRFSHGGLLRFVTRARFLDASRPFRELCVSHALRARGIRTPEVVAARTRAAPGGGYWLDLVTRRVECSTDLGFVLGKARSGAIERGRWRRLVRAAGTLVRALHENGCLHADLTPNNVLVEEDEHGEPRLWILDLDRSRMLAHVGDAERCANLRRLHRFVERREARDGRALSSTDRVRFFRAYDPQGRRWKDDWRRIESAHASRRAWHGLGWILEEGFGGWKSDPRRTHASGPARARADPIE